jgi:small subunit ribosomal protein S14
MAKLSAVNRNEKRKKIVKAFYEKRQQIKSDMRETYKKGEIPWELSTKLQGLPRNSSESRVKRRCKLCGRAHAVYRKFGLCRLCIRIFAMNGHIPGLMKSSW